MLSEVQSNDDTLPIVPVCYGYNTTTYDHVFLKVSKSWHLKDKNRVETGHHQSELLFLDFPLQISPNRGLMRTKFGSRNISNLYYFA